MKYMLLMYGDERLWTDAERAACVAESLAACGELAARGEFVAAAPLRLVAAAATVRVRGGRPLITDGPFAETTEQLGGYYVLELADLDRAIAVAGRLPPARKGTVEIRPLAPLDGLPPARPDPGDPARPPFLLLCYDDEAAWRDAGPDALRAARSEAAALARRLDEAGDYLDAAPLRPASTATCVRVRAGKRLISDGPFAETREVLGGFYLIRAASREEALAVAARHPGARFGSVEVRPLLDTAGLRKPGTIFGGTVDSRAARSAS